jgi:hypothetical protein
MRWISASSSSRKVAKSFSASAERSLAIGTSSVSPESSKGASCPSQRENDGAVGGAALFSGGRGTSRGEGDSGPAAGEGAPKSSQNCSSKASKSSGRMASTHRSAW